MNAEKKSQILTNKIANAFNDFFADRGPNLASKIKSSSRSGSDNSSPTPSSLSSHNGSFFLRPIAINDVKYINNLNPTKSCGPLGIPI